MSIPKSKFTLLATWQADRSREKTLGQGIVTLFRKLAVRDDGLGEPSFLRENLDFFLLKREGVWLFIANFSVHESFILADVQVGLVTL